MRHIRIWSKVLFVDFDDSFNTSRQSTTSMPISTTSTTSCGPSAIFESIALEMNSMHANNEQNFAIFYQAPTTKRNKKKLKLDATFQFNKENVFSPRFEIELIQSHEFYSRCITCFFYELSIHKYTHNINKYIILG